MPDDVRVPYRPEVHIEPPREPVRGFTATNTSGLTAPELVALNRALERLMAAGLSEHDAKLAIDAAVRDWLKPKEAAKTDVERLLAWRWDRTSVLEPGRSLVRSRYVPVSRCTRLISADR